MKPPLADFENSELLAVFFGCLVAKDEKYPPAFAAALAEEFAQRRLDPIKAGLQLLQECLEALGLRPEP